jgi:glycosyltransferase involved in cell wall biosynthesis
MRAAGGYDAVLAYNFLPQTTVPAMVAKVVYSVPVVLEYEDGHFVDTDRVRRTQSRLLRRAFAGRFDGAVCVNRPLAESLPIGNTVIVRGYPSVGMPEELPNPVADDDRTAVMFAGSFDPVRGVDWFVDVAEKVLAERDDVVFWISGYGGRADRVRQRTAGVDGIRFFGTLPWEAYRARLAGADVFLNTQRPDRRISEYTFPSKILDFAVVGVPIVTTDMADLGQELDDVLVVDGRTPESVAETLSDVLKEYQRFTEYGERAREWVSEECSAAAIGRRVDCVIGRSLD